MSVLLQPGPSPLRKPHTQHPLAKPDNGQENKICTNAGRGAAGEKGKQTGREGGREEGRKGGREGGREGEGQGEGRERAGREGEPAKVQIITRSGVWYLKAEPKGRT